jgi:hypothetical protein
MRPCSGSAGQAGQAACRPSRRRHTAPPSARRQGAGDYKSRLLHGDTAPLRLSPLSAANAGQLRKDGREPVTLTLRVTDSPYGTITKSVNALLVAR